MYQYIMMLFQDVHMFMMPALARLTNVLTTQLLGKNVHDIEQAAIAINHGLKLNVALEVTFYFIRQEQLAVEAADHEATSLGQ